MIASLKEPNLMSIAFPRTTVGGVSLPRMIIGTNWMLGYSHTSVAADEGIRARNGGKEAIAAILTTFMEHGIDAVMGPLPGNGTLCDGIALAEDRTGRPVIRVDTPIMNVDDSAAARREAEAVVKESRRLGARFCFPHHSSAEQLMNKNAQAMPRLPDYLKMIRDQGMIPGLSAHMPEMVVFSDQNDYDVETYIQIYNCASFLMQVEVEYVHSVIWKARKPVMTIKPMAAGRVSPFVGITFSFATIRPCDMVTVGCLTPREAREDIEIGLAALERRRPDLEGRASPNKTPIMEK
jgi:hypothetical protein